MLFCLGMAKAVIIFLGLLDNTTLKQHKAFYLFYIINEFLDTNSLPFCGELGWP